MRVIAGKYRHLLLKAPEGFNTRPSLDRVKEATFSIIGFKIENAVCLDLFSGSGSLGIEALSRGAKRVHFNDYNKDSIKIIKDNIANVKITEPYIVTQMDYNELLDKINDKFDIIFLDPPYRDLVVQNVIEKMEEKLLVNPYCIFACETALTAPKIEVVNYSDREYKYGNVKLTILRRIK